MSLSKLFKLANKLEKKIALAGINPDPKISGLRNKFFDPLNKKVIFISGMKEPFNKSGLSKLSTLFDKALPILEEFYVARNYGDFKQKAANRKNSLMSEIQNLLVTIQGYYKWFNTGFSFSSTPLSGHLQAIQQYKSKALSVASSLKVLVQSPWIESAPELKAHCEKLLQAVELGISGFEDMENILGGPLPVEEEKKNYQYNPASNGGGYFGSKKNQTADTEDPYPEL